MTNVADDEQSTAAIRVSTWASKDTSQQATDYVGKQRVLSAEVNRTGEAQAYSRVRVVDLQARDVLVKLEGGTPTRDDMLRALDACTKAYDNVAYDLSKVDDSKVEPKKP